MTTPNYGAPLVTVTHKAYDAEPETWSVGPNWRGTGLPTSEALCASQNARIRLHALQRHKRAERASWGPSGRPTVRLHRGEVIR